MPHDIRTIVGRVELWKSLRTDSKAVAIKRLPTVVVKVESEFEYHRYKAGLTVDHTLLEPFQHDLATQFRHGNVSTYSPANDWSQASCIKRRPTLGEVYRRYMDDPTNAWTETTRQAYQTTHALVVSVLGAELAITGVSRVDVRQLIEVLRFLPKNAVKIFPKLSPQQASDRGRADANVEKISTANANSYLGNFSTFMNWCVREELIARNPARGLRLPDEVAKRDKRHPFSPQQLKQIFNAPLFTGCEDGDRGYAKVGSARPRNARYWVPLIGLHTGMRLNEICQLDTTDVRVVRGVASICVTSSSLIESADKKLKTSGSERIIPLHPRLLELGLVEHAVGQRRRGNAKLFDEIDAGTRGVRAVAFSKWFTQFLVSIGARRNRTSFHSFRHNFRDELRAARVDHDVAMALGGWVAGTSQSSAVAENYGKGHRLESLHEAINSLQFTDIDLSHLVR